MRISPRVLVTPLMPLTPLTPLTPFLERRCWRSALKLRMAALSPVAWSAVVMWGTRFLSWARKVVGLAMLKKKKISVCLERPGLGGG